MREDLSHYFTKLFLYADLPAAKADFIASKMQVLIHKHLLTNLAKQAFQERPRAVRYWIDGTIGTATDTHTYLSLIHI